MNIYYIVLGMLLVLLNYFGKADFTDGEMWIMILLCLIGMDIPKRTADKD